MSEVMSNGTEALSTSTAACHRTAIPAVRVPEGQPDDSWPNEALVAYAMDCLAEAGILARKTTVLVFWAGLALWLLRERLKGDRKWCQYQKEHNLPRTSVWEAIETYLRATEQGLTEKEVGAMPWPEAREVFGIAKTREEPEAPAQAEVANDEDDGQAQAATVATDPIQADHEDGQPEVVAKPAAEAAPKKKAEKKDQAGLTPCEIDAAIIFIKAVGGWKRAVEVLELVKDIVGG